MPLADKICRNLESRCFLQLFIFWIVLDRGGWGNTGKGRTGILGQILATVNTSVLAFPQVLHSSWATDAEPPLWVWKGYSQDCHPLRDGMGTTSLTGTTNFIPQFWLSGMEENETFRTDGPRQYWKIWQLGHTGLKEGSFLKLSPWGHFFTISKSVFTRSLWTMGFRGTFMPLQAQYKGKTVAWFF